MKIMVESIRRLATPVTIPKAGFRLPLLRVNRILKSELKVTAPTFLPDSEIWDASVVRHK